MEIHSTGTVTTSARFDSHGGVNEDFSLLEYACRLVYTRLLRPWSFSEML